MKNLKILLSFGLLAVCLTTALTSRAEHRTVKHDTYVTTYQADQHFIADLQIVNYRFEQAYPLVAYMPPAPVDLSVAPITYLKLIRTKNAKKPDNINYKLIRAKELKLGIVQGSLC